MRHLKGNSYPYFYSFIIFCPFFPPGQGRLERVKLLIQVELGGSQLSLWCSLAIYKECTKPCVSEKDPRTKRSSLLVYQHIKPFSQHQTPPKNPLLSSFFQGHPVLTGCWLAFSCLCLSVLVLSVCVCSLTFPHILTEHNTQPQKLLSKYTHLLSLLGLSYLSSSTGF